MNSWGNYACSSGVRADALLMLCYGASSHEGRPLVNSGQQLLMQKDNYYTCMGYKSPSINSNVQQNGIILQKILLRTADLKFLSGRNNSRTHVLWGLSLKGRRWVARENRFIASSGLWRSSNPKGWLDVHWSMYNNGLWKGSYLSLLSECLLRSLYVPEMRLGLCKAL